MANTRTQTGAQRGPLDLTASTADQHARVDAVESPLRLPILGRGPKYIPRVNLEDPNPVLTEVTPETRMFDNVMKVVAEAMNKQQESFVKMLEDCEASQCRNKAVGENAGNGSGGAEVVAVTEETWMTGEKEKAKAKGCSYKNFLGCKPPEFRGCNEPITCMYWLREMEMAFEASECDDSQRVKFASHLLKGEALTWWNLTRSSLTPEVLARLSWGDFKKKMLEKYCSERSLDKIEEEFQGMKKGKSPVSYYAKEFVEKLGLVEHLAPDEKAKMKASSRGLPAKMRSAVRIPRVTTLHEAIEESLRMEDDITQARVEHYQAVQKRKGGETTMPAQPTRTFQDGKRSGSRNEARWCNKCRSKDFGPCRRDFPMSPTTCGKYGRRGHLARDCVTRVAVCYECKEPGHYRDTCPKLKKAPTGRSSGSVAKGETPPSITAGDAREASDLVSGTFLVNSLPTLILFDTGAERSFVTDSLGKKFTMPTTPLSDALVVEVAGGYLVTVRDCFEGCTIELDGEPFSATLINLRAIEIDMLCLRLEGWVRELLSVIYIKGVALRLHCQVPPGRLKGRAWLEVPISQGAQFCLVKHRYKFDFDGIMRNLGIPIRTRGLYGLTAVFWVGKVLHDVLPGVITQTKCIKFWDKKLALEKQDRRKEDCYFENQSDQKERKHLHEEKKKVVFGGGEKMNGYGFRQVKRCESSQWWLWCLRHGDTSYMRSQKHVLFHESIEIEVVEDYVVESLLRWGELMEVGSYVVGPFKIVTRMGWVKDPLELPSELSQMHKTCNVSWSKKYLVDVSSRDILTAFRLLNDLTVERSIAILERYTKSLRIKEIVMANVQWDQEMTQNSIKNRKWR
ncbi:hypothetical protein OSB04_023804 [Centaurea solstitialis]|uniref:CCHC-type domain-containing protein n=1 Tax=Centaurea solstitialis TaxID=347529 RepID=A0AA38W2L2_9ASTR|nr:hypothetical protein OSB04_023804 [Centaurea solstitialis]